jgi:hypothetical protein
MSDDPIDYADLRRFIEKLQQNKQLSDAEIQRLVLQQVREAVAQKRAAERKEIAREAEIYGEELVRDPDEERARARDTAKSAALLLIMLLLILLLIAAATGRTDIVQFTGARPTATLLPILTSDQGFQTNYVPPTPGTQVVPQVDELFRNYYYAHDGPRVFGAPISPQMRDNGLIVQWFQRARLEYWPNLAPQGYDVQGSLIGARYIDQEKIQFPTQVPFVSQDRVRYFRETGHGLSDRFLDYWNTHDGMRVLGLPISDQLQETLPDDVSHTVQYFERGRVEYHPENNEDQQMLLGLLGQRLYANPKKSEIIAPTRVPLPSSAAPTPVPAAN